MMIRPIATLALETENDIVHARQCARVVAQRLGFAGQDQTRIATALSEIARNAFDYAGGGRIEFLLAGAPERSLLIRVTDAGKGIADLAGILDGRYRSTTGLGLGIVGARRLMDGFTIETTAAGTIITMGKTVPGAAAPTGSTVPDIAAAVRALRAADPAAAIRDQNRDLVSSLASLTEREEEARRLYAELADTNRGVVAMHADLERQAEELRRSGETLERQVAERTRELADANARLRAEAEARERVEADLRQSQKMEAVGQLTGGIAHDFNNLLTVVVGAMDLMRRRLRQQRYEKLDGYIEMALTSANRAAALTHRLLAFARRQPLDPKIVDVNVLITGMADLLKRTVNERIELRFALNDDAWTTLCDPFQLENAILNLAINARDAMPGGGTITVATRNLSAAAPRDVTVVAGDYVVVSVGDTGIGMPPHVVARAFDPFFTTKPLGQGTGLGLSMIYGFARQSDGYARINSAPGEGATIDVLLPRHDGRATATAAVQPGAVAVGYGETVLVVEDEDAVRELLREALSEAGYHVLHACNGVEGLDVARSAPRLDLLVTDVGLPRLNGHQLADAVRQTRPTLKVIFITGYDEAAAGASRSLGPGMAIVTKPFMVDALVARMRDMLDGP